MFIQDNNRTHTHTHTRITAHLFFHAKGVNRPVAFSDVSAASLSDEKDLNSASTTHYPVIKQSCVNTTSHAATCAGTLLRINNIRSEVGRGQQTVCG